MPHKIESVGVPDNFERVLDLAARLELEQELFLRDLNRFQARLEKVEQSIAKYKRGRFSEFLEK